MASAGSRPRLRPVETIVVPTASGEKVLVLRDTLGVAKGHAQVPLPLVPILARFTGRATCAEIAAAAGKELGEEIPVSFVVGLATELEDALYCEGPAFRAAKERIFAEFHDAEVRPASHAGGAYHDDPKKLAHYIDYECHRPAGSKPKAAARVRALVAPHIDPWRGALGYGHAYGALKAALAEGATDEPRTFVILGTSHAPMREPFALCKKAFATPLGPLPCDGEAVDRLAAAARFDPWADEFNHKREHSLEFQTVFLKHLVGERPARIIPILAGLGEHQANATDPAKDDAVRRFLDALAAIVEERSAIVVAGADLAHVGPRFGDPEPLDEAGRASLETRDRASLDLALAAERAPFFAHVAEDLETRRVCGLGPIYSMLSVMPRGLRGELLHYEQNVDPDEGSIVSHAAVAYYGT
jgi:hypothetical protein